MFRLQNKTPEVYTNNSRDFQLFERLFDSVINGVRFDINTIPNILNPLTINDRMIDLLATKLGFFTRENITTDVMRMILSSFSYSIKYKGSITGIKYAVCTILKLEGTFEVPEIIIDNNTYTVRIFTTMDIENKKALKAYLEYIVPVGYLVTIETFTKEKQTTEILSNIQIYKNTGNINEISVVNNTNQSNVTSDENIIDRNVGNYNVSFVVGDNNSPTNNN